MTQFDGLSSKPSWAIAGSGMLNTHRSHRNRIHTLPRQLVDGLTLHAPSVGASFSGCSLLMSRMLCHRNDPEQASAATAADADEPPQVADGALTCSQTVPQPCHKRTCDRRRVASCQTDTTCFSEEKVVSRPGIEPGTFRLRVRGRGVHGCPSGHTASVSRGFVVRRSRARPAMSTR